MSFLDRSIAAVLITIALSLGGFGQTDRSGDDDDTQSWNDIQLAIPVHGKVDLFLTTTYRFGDTISRLNEGRVGGGISIKLHPAFSTAAGYNFIQARNTAGHFRSEHRYHVNAVYKFPAKKIDISHRSQYEYRVRGSGNSWRYRPSITFEKSLPQSFLSKAKLFVTEEPFYDSRAGRFSRNRFSLGIKKTVSDHFALELYYLRQNDGLSVPGDMNVLGTSWKFRL